MDPKDAAIERVAQETAKMGRAERIIHWDKLQAGPEAIVCGHDAKHGRLVINGEGALLMCGGSQKGAHCTYSQPVSL